MSAGSESPTGSLFDDLPPISYVWQTPNRRPRRADWEVPDPGGSRGVTPAMRAKLERIVGRAPEVMVKITGRTKDVGHLKSHLEYIMRNGELTAETEQGAELGGRIGLKDLQARWADDAAIDNKRRRDGSLSVNIILSMPPGTDAVAVKDAVRAFAIETFEDNHDYVFVQHLDDKHPHVHLTVRSLGYDGKRLNPRKADLQAWRDRFARELRLRGVAAEATARRTRGRVRKAERGRVLAIRRRKLIPRVERLAREEILNEARGGGSSQRPWEEKILARQEAIRQRYLDHASELERTGAARDQALALQVRSFVEAMPSLDTQRHALRRELSAYADRVRGEKGRSVEPEKRPGSDRDERER